MEIFNYENHKLSLNIPELLLIAPFKCVIDEDKSKDKKHAFAVFTYIYLVLDWNSPYREFTESEKREEAKKNSGLKDVDIEKPSFIAAYTEYDKIRNSNRIIRYIRSTWEAIDKLEKYCQETNLQDTITSGARKGSLVHSINDYRNTIKQMPELIVKARELRTLLAEEQKEDSSIRGGGEISPLLDF